ncbi:MAG: bifunctional methyltransferase/pyrophosphohydrolase YabN [Aggregatilineales bacterium]
MNITIVGLGPGDPELLTRRAWNVLSGVSDVYLRTARHPGVEALPSSAVYHNFDDWYEQAADFETLYQRIAAEVVRLGARSEGVVYAVPGHPLVGETTVTRILALAKAESIPVTIVDGLSFIEPTLAALGLDGLDGLQLIDAVDLARLHHPSLNPDVPALLAQMYSHAVASDVKLTLANEYPDEHPVILTHGAGTAGQMLEHVALYEIDRSPHIGHLTSLYVPPLPHAGSFERFQETIAHLRAPEGCPWDQKQTHQSLRPYLLEETYETLAALDADDPAALCEELGDLLLQIVLHAQIATDDAEFRMADVIEGINRKIVRRHPHVWGEAKAADAEAVLANWEKLKQKERAQAGPEQPKSLLDSMPVALPALALAHLYGTRSAKVGFDWSTPDEVFAKVEEELREVHTAPDADARAKELGDVLFSVAQWARHYGVEPETALREANARWAGRFRYVEAHANGDLSALSVEQLNTLWDAAKADELAAARSNGHHKPG